MTWSTLSQPLGDAEQEYRSFRKSSLMLSDAFESFTQIFSPPFRGVMWKSVGLTAIVLFLLGLGLDRLASSLMPAAPAWLSWILSIAVALGLIASMTLLAAPTASLVASFYLDDIADVVEREIDPTGPRGRPLPLRASLYVGLRFAALSLIVNLAVVALTLFTGVGFAAFFVLNGYLLGREYFELAAMRHLTFSQAVQLRRQRSFDVVHRRHDRCGLRRRSSAEPIDASLRDRVHDADDEAPRLTSEFRVTGGHVPLRDHHDRMATGEAFLGCFIFIMCGRCWVLGRGIGVPHNGIALDSGRPSAYVIGQCRQGARKLR